MIFGFFKKRDNDDQDDDDEEIDPVRFLGAVNGKEPNLAEHKRLTDAGLVPAKDLVTDALARRAETIRLEIRGPQAAVQFLIDGIPQSGGKFSKSEGVAITQVLKLLAGLDAKVRNANQAGAIKGEFEETKYLFEIKVQPGTEGERLTVRCHNQTIKRDTLVDLGMTEELRQKIRQITCGVGVVLVVGPSGSGTSTTLYATLRNVDTYMYTACTLGDMGGRTLLNISPFEANPNDDLKATLQRAQRKETNIICIDRVTDADMLKQMFSFVDEIMVLSEMEAKDACAGVLSTLEMLGGDKELLTKGLKGILSQKLLRVLCPECRQAYRPKPDFLKKAGLPETATTLYRKPPDSVEQDPDYQPCENCNATGYKGRAAMFEFFEMTDGMKQLILEGADAAALRTAMRREKQVTLQSDALRLVAEGKTSLEELQRVFSEGSSGSKPPPRKA